MGQKWRREGSGVWATHRLQRTAKPLDQVAKKNTRNRLHSTPALECCKPLENGRGNVVGIMAIVGSKWGVYF